MKLRFQYVRSSAQDTGPFFWMPARAAAIPNGQGLTAQQSCVPWSVVATGSVQGEFASVKKVGLDQHVKSAPVILTVLSMASAKMESVSAALDGKAITAQLMGAQGSALETGGVPWIKMVGTACVKWVGVGQAAMLSWKCFVEITWTMMEMV